MKSEPKWCWSCEKTYDEAGEAVACGCPTCPHCGQHQSVFDEESNDFVRRILAKHKEESG